MFLGYKVVIKQVYITCTVIACSNASRSVISPWVVLDRKFLKPKYTYGEVPVTTYALSGVVG